MTKVLWLSTSESLLSLQYSLSLLYANYEKKNLSRCTNKKRAMGNRLKPLKPPNYRGKQQDRRKGPKILQNSQKTIKRTAGVSSY